MTQSIRILFFQDWVIFVDVTPEFFYFVVLTVQILKCFSHGLGKKTGKTPERNLPEITTYNYSTIKASKHIININMPGWWSISSFNFLHRKALVKPFLWF